MHELHQMKSEHTTVKITHFAYQHIFHSVTEFFYLFYSINFSYFTSIAFGISSAIVASAEWLYNGSSARQWNLNIGRHIIGTSRTVDRPSWAYGRPPSPPSTAFPFVEIATRTKLPRYSIERYIGHVQPTASRSRSSWSIAKEGSTNRAAQTKVGIDRRWCSRQVLGSGRTQYFQIYIKITIILPQMEINRIFVT